MKSFLGSPNHTHKIVRLSKDDLIFSAESNLIAEIVDAQMRKHAIALAEEMDKNVRSHPPSPEDDPKVPLG